jgi:hypothetical protein
MQSRSRFLPLMDRILGSKPAEAVEGEIDDDDVDDDDNN